MAEDKKKINTFEEALDFAISREVEACDFYMKWAALVQKPEMVKVLKDMAVEEQQHKIRLPHREEAEHRLRFEIEYDPCYVAR